MQARWDVKGSGEWRDNAITLSSLSTGFDKLEYGTMRVSTPRLTLEQPIRWLRDAEHPRLTGALSLDAAKTTFSGGSYLPASTVGTRRGSSSPAPCMPRLSVRCVCPGAGMANGCAARRGGQNSR